MTAAECVAGAMDNGLRQVLEELEQGRQQMLGKNRTIMQWVAGITAVIIVWLISIAISWFVCALTALVGLIVGVIITGRRKGQVGYHYKDRAIPEILKHALPDFSYYGANCISQDEFVGAGLFITPDNFSGKDYFEGRIDKTELHFSLVHAEERYETTTTDTDSDGKTTTRTEEHWRDIFKGLFFVADFNKHFNGCTLVRTGKAGIFSGFSNTLVKLEDPRFNKCFTAYSSDQVEARYLLTPKMMEQLVQLQDSIGGFEASFRGSSIYIAAGGFPYDAFEPNMKLPCTDQKQLTGILGWVFTVANVVEELDLNTRIWSKQ
jgi:hypothetical protein